MFGRAITAAVIGIVATSGSVGAHERRHEERHDHWRGSFREYDLGLWRGGYWHNGWYEGRMGWWWIAGGRWYHYPAPVYPYPSPYAPPVVMAPAGPPGQVWYYCGNPAGYYPYVPQCMMQWQQVMPQPAAQPSEPMMMMAPPPATPSSSGPGLDKSTGGTVLGAVGGGLAGAQFGHGSGKLAATAAGTLLGAFVGHEVGSSLDRADQAASQQAAQRAYQAPLGQGIAWSSPENGHSGTITPTREGQDSSGNSCREFQQSVIIEGKVAQATGTACRQGDGTWKVIDR
jgi:surface antigen